MSVTDRPVAVITGASSGIGREAAIRLSELDYTTVLIGRRRDELEATARAAKGEGHRVYEADLARSEQAAELMRTIVRDMGRIDVLVNNAGMAQLGPLSEGVLEKDIRAHLELNTVTPAIMIATAWPHLMQGSGACIINMSSMATVDPFPGFFSYALSKSPLNIMLKSCATEGAPQVRAFGIAPGCVETPLLRELFDADVVGTDLTISAEDVASLIVECVTGQWDARNGQVIAIERKNGDVVRWPVEG